MGEVVRLRALLDELSREHRRLMSALTDLEQAGSGRGFRSRLLRLQRTLVLHFGHEQLSDGLYDTLALRDSPFAAEVAALVEEHRCILGLVDDLVDGADASALAPIVTQEKRLDELRALILAHEKREGRLVQAALAQR